MAGDRKDDLAHERTAPAPSTDLDRTATQVPQSKKPAPADPSHPTRLGRYTIERELGAGGMGIVYAAFDPDLERRVALKVLLSPDGHDAHKQRLLREARAMARLTHPNVVTVHEVQTSDGRDYVAMELVEGESLAEWLRKDKRSEADILAAFVAAGRGLAAAHAAGMVHRDFKPHNVLRSKAGRIAVTDFGLAREAHADPLAITGVASPPVAGTPVNSSTPSTPLAGLTMTGSVLGTPAYMAPEQWTGGTVSAATDQFAFCVALWEALAGERPFHGDTLDVLKRAVELGPAQLDDSKLPPRLRPIIRRGLDPVASRRWPSMDALIAELAPAAKKKIPWLQIGFAAVGLAGFGIYLATRSSDPTGVSVAPGPGGCPPPAQAPATAFGDRPLEAAALRRDVESWKALREKACALEPTKRDVQLTCLDRVMSRLDTVARGLAKSDVANREPVDVAKYLIDPAVCESNPRLEPVTPALGDAIAVAIREDATPGPTDRAAVAALLERVGSDACGSAWAHMLGAKLASVDRSKHMADAEQDAERCRDDRIRAEIAIRAAAFTIGRAMFGMPNSAKIKLAAAAVERVSQPDLVAEVEAMQMTLAVKADNVAGAIVLGERAMAGFAARGRIPKQLDVGVEVNGLREIRGTADDRQRVQRDLESWHALATKELGAAHPTTRDLEISLAMQLFSTGDARAAQDKLEKLRGTTPLDRVRRIQVRVVDATNQPVAGAVVTAGANLWAAGSTAAFPDPQQMSLQRSATTPASGEVTLESSHDGMVIAQLADRRSRPALIADGVITLVLEPTSRIEGKVELRGENSTHVMVALSDKRLPPSIRYEMIAPIAADGSFVLEGAPRTTVKLYAQLQMGLSRSVTTIDLPISAPIVKDIKLAISNHKRTVYVVVRSTVSTPVEGAQVFVQPGKASATTLDKVRVDGSAAIRFARVPDEAVPASVKSSVRSGELVAALTAPPTGIVSACAIGMPADVDDPDLDRKIRDNLKRIEVRCVVVPDGAETVVVEVPPWPRLD